MNSRRGRPGGDPPAGGLLDPGAFWDDGGPENPEATAPDLELEVEVDAGELDTDVFLVKAGQNARAPAGVSRPAPPPPGSGQPVSRPAAPVSRPAAPVSRPAAPVSRPAAPVSRPAAPVSRPVAPVPRPEGPPPAPLDPEEIGLGSSRLRTVLLLLAVAAGSGLLGWLLVGRHTEESGPPPEAQAEPARPADDARPERETPAPEPARQTLRLTVLSDPSSAEVLVDGKFRGLTPVTLEALPAGGEVLLRVQTPGHRPWEQRLSLETDQEDLQITAGLQKEEGCAQGSGWVYVSSEPSGASVELGGKRLPGKTPMVIDKVCAGQAHKLLVQHPGKKAWSGVVEVQPGEVRNLNLELTR